MWQKMNQVWLCLQELIMRVEADFVGSPMLSRGDHVSVSRGVYDHHGVCIGFNNILHHCGHAEDVFWSLSGFPMSPPDVRIDTLEKFVGKKGGRVKVIGCGKLREDCLFLTGPHQYHILNNNCEHFANFALQRPVRSMQIENVKSMLVITVVFLMVVVVKLYRKFKF